ncbi:hypothetical protein DFJ74DRAFT_693905 [Hyaloraphidium curvatum]|nr:hypothetical protein DFJ74DRAFT_693905 [Hyaloraphidium curvatum]
MNAHSSPEMATVSLADAPAYPTVAEPKLPVAAPTAPGTPSEPAPSPPKKTWAQRLGWTRIAEDEDGVDPLVNSWFLGPKGVLATRSILSAWQLGILIACVVTSEAPTYWLTYFTNQTFTALTAILLIATGLSAAKVIKGDAAFATSPRWFAIAMKFLLAIQPPLHLVVTVAYWALLAKGFQFLSFAEHGLEFVVACIEWFLCNRVVLTWTHLLVILNVGLLFMFFSWVIYATVPPPGSDGSQSSGFWIYGFLDWSNPMNAVYYVLILILLCVGYFLFAVLTDKVRDPLGRKRAARAVAAAATDSGAAAGEKA